MDNIPFLQGWGTCRGEGRGISSGGGGLVEERVGEFSLYLIREAVKLVLGCLEGGGGGGRIIFSFKRSFMNSSTVKKN